MITFSFEITKEGQSDLVRAIETLKEQLRNQGYTISLFRDTSHQNRFLQIFLTDKTVDELTDMIHREPEAKAVFEKIKESESRVVVSCMEQIL